MRRFVLLSAALLLWMYSDTFPKMYDGAGRLSVDLSDVNKKAIPWQPSIVKVPWGTRKLTLGEIV